ncbi:hypothetical protein QFZ52_002549 [Arthrobacter woluwensis]|nr:hypothetical protein [Arthrobacter woluwensis]
MPDDATRRRRASCVKRRVIPGHSHRYLGVTDALRSGESYARVYPARPVDPKVWIMSSQYPGAPGTAPSNQPPAGLGYAAPARNSFGFDTKNLAVRLKDVSGVPQQLAYSYWLWVAGAVLGVLLSIINVFLLTATYGSYAGIAIGASVGGIIWSIIWAAVVIFIAVRLKEGSRWARIVLSILGGLAVIGLIVGLVGLSITAIGSAVTVAAAVLMWLPESQKHFV